MSTKTCTGSESTEQEGKQPWHKAYWAATMQEAWLEHGLAAT